MSELGDCYFCPGTLTSDLQLCFGGFFPPAEFCGQSGGSGAVQTTEPCAAFPLATGSLKKAPPCSSCPGRAPVRQGARQGAVTLSWVLHAVPAVFLTGRFGVPHFPSHTENSKCSQRGSTTALSLPTDPRGDGIETVQPPEPSALLWWRGFCGSAVVLCSAQFGAARSPLR